MKTNKKICKWCRKPFTIPAIRANNAVKYCSDTCRKNAIRDQNLMAQRRYQMRYKWLLKDADKRGQLGEVRLGVKPNANFEIEQRLIEKELNKIRHYKMRGLYED